MLTWFFLVKQDAAALLKSDIEVCVDAVALSKSAALLKPDVFYVSY